MVDGGSTDGTIEYAREQGYQVYVQKEPGIRQAYMEALPLVEGDVIITFSPDGNSIPELILPLIDKMKEGYDMVIVSRYLDGAKSDDDDFLTGWGNWFFTTTCNILFGFRYTDCHGHLSRLQETAHIRSRTGSGSLVHHAGDAVPHPHQLGADHVRAGGPVQAENRRDPRR